MMKSGVQKTVRKIVASKLKSVNGLKINGKDAFSRIGLSLLGIKSNADAYLMKTHTVVKSIRINEKTTNKSKKYHFQRLKSQM